MRWLWKKCRAAFWEVAGVVLILTVMTALLVGMRLWNWLDRK